MKILSIWDVQLKPFLLTIKTIVPSNIIVIGFLFVQNPAGLTISCYFYRETALRFGFKEDSTAHNSPSLFKTKHNRTDQHVLHFGQKIPCFCELLDFSGNTIILKHIRRKPTFEFPAKRHEFNKYSNLPLINSNLELLSLSGRSQSSW